MLGVLGSLAFFGFMYLLWHVLRPSASQLDDAGMATGNEPEAAPLPGGHVATTQRVAVGAGWVALYHRGWRVLPIREIATAAVVPPSQLRELVLMRGWTAQGPYLALRTITGRVLRVDWHDLTPATRTALREQLPATTSLTMAADRFLSDGVLPGRWGRPWQVYGFRFGFSRSSAR